MKVAVLDVNGKDTGRQVELSDAIFGIGQTITLFVDVAALG